MVNISEPIYIVEKFRFVKYIKFFQDFSNTYKVGWKIFITV